MTAVSAGYGHSLALLGTGKVMAWGDNNDGQLGDGVANTTGCGCRDTPVAVRDVRGATAVSAGYFYSLALLGTGTVAAWGENLYGQLGDGATNSAGCTCKAAAVAVTNLSGVTAISAGAGDGHSLALLGTGTVAAWGENLYGQLGNGTTNTTGCDCGRHLPGI